MEKAEWEGEIVLSDGGGKSDLLVVFDLMGVECFGVVRKLC